MNNLELVQGKIVPITGGADSLFITCVSYEERTALGVRKLDDHYITGKSLVCLAAEYRDKGHTPKHLKEVMTKLSPKSQEKPEELVFSLEDPIAYLQSLEEQIGTQKLGNLYENVTVDISTFPRQELLMLLRYLDSRPGRGKIRLLYSEPERYGTEETNKRYKWLTRGVRSVNAVPGFAGIQYPLLAKLLVVILGHEGERTHINNAPQAPARRGCFSWARRKTIPRWLNRDRRSGK